MVTRREFVHAGAAAAGVVALEGCAPAGDHSSYDSAVRRTWRVAERVPSDPPLVLRELVRYATLAPSSHNTQCWTFAISPRSITIAADFSRRCPAVDPDDHHLFTSLGCAAENLLQAAAANGFHGEVTFDSSAPAEVRIALEPVQSVAAPLFTAIPARQCTRAEFDGQPLSNAELSLLQQAGTGNGVHTVLVTERRRMEEILDQVVIANTAQMRDRAFVAELKSWIRFSDDEAVQTGDGLFSRTTGNPSVPRWIGSLMFPLLFRTSHENDKYAKQIRSSAGIAIFASESDDRAQWVEAGRCYERFALQATAIGVRHAHLNQPVEIADLRGSFARSVGIGDQRPNLIVRFGRGPEMPRSLRRPLDAVMV